MVALALNQSDKAAVHIKRRHHQFFQAGIAGEASQCVENDCYFLGQFRFTGEQTKIRVDPGGARVIIAGAQVDVAPELIRVAANDQQCLAMRF